MIPEISKSAVPLPVLPSRLIVMNHKTKMFKVIEPCNRDIQEIVISILTFVGAMEVREVTELTEEGIEVIYLNPE